MQGNKIASIENSMLFQIWQPNKEFTENELDNLHLTELIPDAEIE
jgi:hypothetical protein